MVMEHRLGVPALSGQQALRNLASVFSCTEANV